MLTALLLAVAFLNHPPGSCVLDVPRALLPADVSALEAECRRLDGAGRAAVAVAVVDDLQGEDRPAYAAGLFRAWGLGHRGRDDGLLILLALPPAARGIKVEVGYGLEGALNDGKVMAILREKALPDLRAGRYGAALLALVREYGAAADPPAAAPPAAAGDSDSPSLWWLLFIPGVALLIGGMVWVLNRVEDDEPDHPSGGYVPLDYENTLTPHVPLYRRLEQPGYEEPAAATPPLRVVEAAPSYSPSPDPDPSPDPSPSFGGFDGGTSGGGGGDTSF